MENSHVDYPVGSAEAVNYSQLICETLELLLTSRDSELFIKAKLRGKKKKNLFKHAKESKNWQNYRLF